MKIILMEPSNTSTVLRFLGRVLLTCFVLPEAFAACMDDPDAQSATIRMSHLNEAPKAIQNLARSIQGKNHAQIRSIFIQRFGPSQHKGSGLDIEFWDVEEGSLVVAVGMNIAAHPPRRSVRAELPHTAPPSDTSVEAYIGIWMKSAGTRNPPFEDRPQTIPVWLPPLTAPA